MCKCMSVCLYGCMYEYIDGCMDECMNECIDGCMYAWMYKDKKVLECSQPIFYLIISLNLLLQLNIYIFDFLSHYCGNNIKKEFFKVHELRKSIIVLYIYGCKSVHPVLKKRSKKLRD